MNLIQNFRAYSTLSSLPLSLFENLKQYSCQDENCLYRCLIVSIELPLLLRSLCLSLRLIFLSLCLSVIVKLLLAVGDSAEDSCGQESMGDWNGCLAAERE